MNRTSRYNLLMPQETYDKLFEVAQQEETTIADLLRRAIKLYFLIRSIRDNPEHRLLVQSNDNIKEIVLDFI